MDSIIVCGMQFGDEGKGTFIDYVTWQKQAEGIIRYNGGSQSSHTVITPSGKFHKFSQLGSGMFFDKCHTYITENMVVNLENLMVELEFFSKATGINISDLIPRVHIHEDCYMVTPYHKLLNKLRELSKGNNRRGSVGTGVSEVKYLLLEKRECQNESKLGLQVKDIYYQYRKQDMIKKLEELQMYVQRFYQENEASIWRHMPEEMKETMKAEIDYCLASNNHLQAIYDYRIRLRWILEEANLKRCIYNTYALSFRKKCRHAVWEGSQGLLIDGRYGLKPNTTFLDTTNQFALSIAYPKDKIKKVGVAKAFTSRHGPGVFPTEALEVSSKILDNNQEESFWNGKIRFGWFDAVLLRYAQSINQVDALYLSCLDELSNFKTIKICDSYEYKGVVDKEFLQTFCYMKKEDGRIIITEIKDNRENISKYLEQCIPQYIELPGWEQDITKQTNGQELPPTCKSYIELIEQLTHIPITVISVGPTRENKIKWNGYGKGGTNVARENENFFTKS